MPIERQPLREEVQQVLRDWIVEERLAPGSEIREPRLAAELGVSRTPVREALLALEREGFIRSTMNKGFAVTSVNEQVVRETYPILGALEALAVRLQGEALGAACPELLRLNERMRAGGDGPTLYALDLEWHGLLWQGCPNARLVQTIEDLKQLARRFDGAYRRGMANLAGSCDQHAEIAEALGRGEIDLASRRLEAHWNEGIGVVLRWLESREGGAA